VHENHTRLCRNVSSLVLNILVLSAVTIQFGRLFHMLTTRLVKQYLRQSYLNRTFCNLISLPLVLNVHALFVNGTTSVSCFPNDILYVSISPLIRRKFQCLIQRRTERWTDGYAPILCVEHAPASNSIKRDAVLHHITGNATSDNFIIWIMNKLYLSQLIPLKIVV